MEANQKKEQDLKVKEERKQARKIKEQKCKTKCKMKYRLDLYVDLHDNKMYTEILKLLVI